MRHALVVVSSNRLPERETATALQALAVGGVAVLELHDCGDVALARNLALSSALRKLELRELEHVDTVLMVDDDMAFTPAMAQAVVDCSRVHRLAASGAYKLADGRLAAQHLEGNRWLTGLGFLAIPKALLRELAAASPRFKRHARATELEWHLTWSGIAAPHSAWPDAVPIWEGEDFVLTRRLGGALLTPVRVGHVKKRVLMLDERQLTEHVAELTKVEP